MYFIQSQIDRKRAIFDRVMARSEEDHLGSMKQRYKSYKERDNDDDSQSSYFAEMVDIDSGIEDRRNTLRQSKEKKK